MSLDNKMESDLKDNRYACAEVEVFCGEDFEKAYNDYLNRRVAMAMKRVTEYVYAGGDANALVNILEREM